MRILNVAEKNEAAKNIAAILGQGRTTRREGCSRFNKIYEFPMAFNGANCLFVMTSVSGHLLNYEFPQSFRPWYLTFKTHFTLRDSCNPLTLFDAPIVKKCITECESIMRTLEREIRNCSHLIIWTDCDREGENIGTEVVEVCQRVKPSIHISRARFSEITPVAIIRAVNNLVTLDERVSEAVDARQELDLRIGAAFTRFQTLRLKRVFPRALGDQLISYGSCQFPTLGFVVERFREVDSFIPEPFWKITVENPIGKIISVLRKPKSKWRPLPMDTVEMEKLASRKLRINAKETMSLAESLYTKGYISYPRTETNSFPQELDLKPLVEAQIQDGRWSDFAKKYLAIGLKPRNGRKSDQAHPPIHPLKAGTNLQGNEARLYELITRHFLACVSEDAKGAETTVRLLLGAADSTAASSLKAGEVFEARGLVIHNRNYLEVYYPYEGWSERHMPAFELGEIVTPDKIEMTEGSTTAPNLLTEADLIALMEKNGIGTDATHADHIETIKKRAYVGVQDAKFLVPSQLGMGLVEGYDSMNLAVAKPCLRADLEVDLKAICEGRKTKDEVLQAQLAKYKSAYELVVREARKLDIAIGKHLSQEAENIPDSTSNLIGGMSMRAYQKLCSCPSCGKDVVVRQKGPQDSNDFGGSTQSSSNRTRWFLTCTGFPDCKFAIWLPGVVTSASVVTAEGQGVTRVTPSVPCKSIDGASCSGGGTLIGLKFRLGTVLPCGYVQEDPDMEYVTCLFCDDEFRMAFDIQITPTTTTAPSAPRSVLSGQQRPIPSVTPNQPNRSFFTMTSSTQRPDPPPRSHPRLSSTFSPPSSLNANGFQGGGGYTVDESNPVVCSCGIPARLFTVRKVGPNQGKKFYKCGDGSDVCNFFLWQDSSTGSAPNYSLTGDSGVGLSNGGVTCSCGLPAVRRTVSQSTANRGRHFFVCPNGAPGSSSGCRFFQWADTAPSRHSSRSHGSCNDVTAPSFADLNENWPPTTPLGGCGSRCRRSRGAGSSGGSSGGGVRKCSICHLPGHTRNRCPSALRE
ncbi:DNA topoisomerase 3-alpha [Taenia crassiceps]|uniref:DNA topoisomerase n=1 Tax=Taenia crassiceps TaxID=6207 RepID=A0ABR4QAR2_9CEST